MQHGQRDLGMELDAKPGAVPQRLVAEDVALGKQRCARRQIKTLAVPLVDVFRPWTVAGAALGGANGIVTDLDQVVRVAVDPAAEMADQHLRSEADAQERPPVAQRHADPVDLASDIGLLLVHAHRSAEYDGADVLIHAVGQGVAEAGAADIEVEAALGQQPPHAPRRGGLLVDDDENPGLVGHCASSHRALPGRNVTSPYSSAAGTAAVSNAEPSGISST